MCESCCTYCSSQGEEEHPAKATNIQVMKTKIVSVFALKVSSDLHANTLCLYLLGREVTCQKPEKEVKFSLGSIQCSLDNILYVLTNIKDSIFNA